MSERFNKFVLPTVKVLAFILTFFMLLHYLSVAFVPKHKNDQSGMVGYITNSYIGENKNSIDVFIVGNSDAYRGISPMTIWNETGISSCVSGKGNQTVDGAYDVIKKMYKYQNPKVVIIETDMLYKDLGTKPSPHHNVKKPSKIDKFKNFLATNFSDTEDALLSGIGYYFPIIKYHNRWNKINTQDFTDTKSSYSFAYKGFICDFNVKAYEGETDYMGNKNDNEEKFSSDNRRGLDRIVRLCNKKNSKIVFVEVPSATSWNYSRHNRVQRYAKENSIEFIDFNTKLNEIKFDWTIDTKDSGNHLNTYGAEKVSSFLANHLANSYNLQNNKSNDSFKKWNECYNKYSTEFSKNKIQYV